MSIKKQIAHLQNQVEALNSSCEQLIGGLEKDRICSQVTMEAMLLLAEISLKHIRFNEHGNSMSREVFSSEIKRLENLKGIAVSIDANN